MALDGRLAGMAMLIGCMTAYVYAQAPESVQVQPSRFVLKGVTVVGMTVYRPEEVRALYADKLGKVMTQAEVEQLAARLNGLYRKDGYVLSSVVVPDNAFEGGQVRLVAVEGFVENVRFDFGAHAERPANARQVAAASRMILASRPLNSRTLERALLLLNRLPGVSANAQINPAPTGPAELVVNVGYRPFSGEVAVDNLGTHYTGPGEVRGRVALNDVWGDGGTLGLQVMASSDFNEMRAGEVSYRHPLGESGLNMKVLAAATRVKPGYDLVPFHLRQNVDRYEVMLGYPVMLRQDESLGVGATLSYVDDDFSVMGSRIYRDRVRALRFGADWNKADGWLGNDFAALEVSRGFEGLGASKKGDTMTSNPRAKPDFTKVNLTLGREQFFTSSPFSLYGSVGGQYADGPLYSSEQFGIGGMSYLSGFSQNQDIGDNGVDLRLEPRLTRQLDAKYLERVQYYTYYDSGVVHSRAPFAGQPASTHLTMVGAGVRLFAVHGVRLNVEAAKPVVGTIGPYRDDGPRVFFTLSKAF